MSTGGAATLYTQYTLYDDCRYYNIIYTYTATTATNTHTLLHCIYGHEQPIENFETPINYRTIAPSTPQCKNIVIVKIKQIKNKNASQICVYIHNHGRNARRQVDDTRGGANERDGFRGDTVIYNTATDLGLLQDVKRMFGRH